MERRLDINALHALAPHSTSCAAFGSDYVYMRFCPAAAEPHALDVPTRIAGLTICMVRKGQLSGEIDFQPFDLTPGSLLILGEANVLRFNHTEGETETEGITISADFIKDLNLDLKSIDIHSLFEEKITHVVSDLSREEVEKFASVLSLLKLNTRTNPDTAFAKNIARCQVQTLFYLLLQLRDTRIGAHSEQHDPTQPRQIAHVQDFMRLLQLHHSRHRSIAFYADKLCISPKYLSHQIKEATGRSATDWIGNFVVQEAKNLLRYSNKNIQQIAYELNFSTQSSFGKYFKHITGLSPSEFKKT